MRLQKRPPLWAPNIKEFAMGAPRVHFYPKTLIFTAHGRKTLILGCTRRAPSACTLKSRKIDPWAVNIKVFGQNQGNGQYQGFWQNQIEEPSDR